MILPCGTSLRYCVTDDAYKLNNELNAPQPINWQRIRRHTMEPSVRLEKILAWLQAQAKNGNPEAQKTLEQWPEIQARIRASRGRELERASPGSRRQIPSR